MKPLGLGIIGLHHQHPRWYYPLFDHLPEYRPVAVADEDREFLESENRYFNLEPYTDYRNLLAREDIDIVLIFLPHSRMPEAVKAAAEAGKHIIVEKPCAASLGGMEEIAETVSRYPHLKISAPYCWRMHPVSERIQSAVSGGLIGTVTAMEARLNAGSARRYIRDNCPWVLKSSEGGGPMWNLGVHWIDYFRWVTGREIVSVAGAASGPYGEPERDIEDNAQALFLCDNGAVGILDISYSLSDHYPGKRDIYLSLRGTAGSVSWAPAWQGTTDEMLLVSDHESRGDNHSERIEIVSKDIPGYGGHMGWAWLKDFAETVRGDSEPSVSIDDMLAAVRVANAFYRSVESGKREPLERSV